jgi:hypothetical protein
VAADLLGFFYPLSVVQLEKLKPLPTLPKRPKPRSRPEEWMSTIKISVSLLPLILSLPLSLPVCAS